MGKMRSEGVAVCEGVVVRVSCVVWRLCMVLYVAVYVNCGLWDLQCVGVVR